MAKGAGKGKTTENKSVKPSEVRPSISANKLKDLLRSSRNALKDTSEINGALGQKIAAAVENDHLHRKAFNVVKMADRMEPEKLADFLDCLDHYLDISGLNDRAASAPRLSMDPGDSEEHDNVAPFPGAAAAE